MALKQKTISILGSTGSIGKQTLDVLKSVDESFRIAYLTANSKIDLLMEQIKEFNPVGVVIHNEKAYRQFKENYHFNGIILCGTDGLKEAAADSINDLVLSALVGFSGVEPTLAAIKAGNHIALANKESLVSAGSIITEAAKKYQVDIIAVDSEHSAILQCIAGESIDEIEKIILTASGGPFLDTPENEFSDLTVKQALNHPNWSMGNKITIDSATLMNKGFEVIEAFWLFGLNREQIDVLVHPQSIIHSMVQFVDGSVKAQMGLPDMRIPISYALSYPRRMSNNFQRMDLSKLDQLTFRQPDYEKFPCLKLAFQALDTGGVAPAIINAANEIAVNAFLGEKISFIRIAQLIEGALNKFEIINNPSIDEIIETDLKVRHYIEQEIQYEN